MRAITVFYHQEDGDWWAESPDLSGFGAAGRSLAEVRRLVRDGLPFYLDGGDAGRQADRPGAPTQINSPTRRIAVLPEVIEVDYSEGAAILDRAARRKLGIGGPEFLSRWDAGNYLPGEGQEHVPANEVAMLIPFARAVPACGGPRDDHELINEGD